MGARRVVSNLLIVVLTVAAVGLTIAAFSKDRIVALSQQRPQESIPAEPVEQTVEPPAETASTAPMSVPSEQVVAFLGDGYIQGIGGEGTTIPDSVGRLNGWTTINLGLSASGWTYTTPNGQQFCRRPTCLSVPQMVPEAISHMPTMVVMSAGFNDNDNIEQVVTEVVRQLQDELPDAKIVLVNPIYGADPYPQSLAQRGIELGRVADATGVSYIDIAQPMAGHYEWMFDGIYPNAQGYEAIAQVLAPELATVVSG